MRVYMYQWPRCDVDHLRCVSHIFLHCCKKRLWRLENTKIELHRHNNVHAITNLNVTSKLLSDTSLKTGNWKFLASSNPLHTS